MAYINEFTSFSSNIARLRIFVNKNYQGNVTTKITYDYGVWG